MTSIQSPHSPQPSGSKTPYEIGEKRYSQSPFPREVAGHIYSNLLGSDRTNFKVVCRIWREGANEIVNKLVLPRILPKTARGVSAIFPMIQELEGQKCDLLEDKNLIDFGKLTHLKMLRFNDVKNITGKGLAHLIGLKNLLCLQLESCPHLDDSSLQCLKHFSALETLKLSNCPQISGPGLNNLSELRRLQTLDIDSCDASSDEGLKYIAKLKRLRFLFLSQSLSKSSEPKITQVGLKRLRRLKRLIALKLDNCACLTERAILELAHLKKLTMLSLVNCRDLSLAAIYGAIYLKNLAILDLSYCPVKVSHLEFKQEARPELNVEVSGCNVDAAELKKCPLVFASATLAAQKTSIISQAFRNFVSISIFYMKGQDRLNMEKISAHYIPSQISEELTRIKCLMLFNELLWLKEKYNDPETRQTNDTINVDEDSRSFGTRIWRGICWAWQQSYRFLTLVLHLIGL